MYTQEKIWIAKSGDEKVCIEPVMANRHGLIAGATGTGKTITLKVLAESFSDCGVPVFLADAKGDLAGMCKAGEDSENMQKRIQKFGLDQEGFSYQSYPTEFWDIYAEQGHPLRATVSEMGPLLLARLLDLNETQEDILAIAFQIADDNGLLLVDIKDLRATLQYIGDHASEYTTKYGNIPKQSVGAIVRSLVALEGQGGDQFFGEPALDIRDWFKTDGKGRGCINVLSCEKLMNSPSMYATFMLWMLSELFEILPEAGDAAKPKMVFFFDEAHMLFDNASKALLQKIEQVVKLIRSKGVGIYFITQSPTDIPDEVLGQLGNRIQHALRAYTPAEQKSIKAAAQSFRVNSEFNTEEVLTQMGIGEALISVLDGDGKPTIVQRSFILPPQSKMGAISSEDRKAVMDASLMAVKYDTSTDRDSAYEFLNRKSTQEQEEAEKAKEEEELKKQKEKEAAAAQKAKEKEVAAAQKAKERKEAAEERKKEAQARKTASMVGKAASSTMNTIGREVGKSLIRGLFKNLKKF